MDLSEKGVFKMTLEEALRFIDPETDMDALAEVEYYNGFKGKEAAAKTLREASQMVVDFVRRVSWHDAKTPPPVHDESWENAGEKHCCIMSELVWVCCESRNTMKGWIENGKWYIEDGRPAADTAGLHPATATSGGTSGGGLVAEESGLGVSYIAKVCGSAPGINF